MFEIQALGLKGAVPCADKVIINPYPSWPPSSSYGKGQKNVLVYELKLK